MEQLTLDIGIVKQEIKDRLNRAAQDFVFVGYRLRQILDTGAYAQEGYSDIYSFAKEEFGLGVSAVSRFMAINKKYSVGGYGEELRIEFQNYGSSKLSEMLTLSDADLALIEEKTPVSQIREFKNFIKNEPKEEIAGQQSFMDEPEIVEPVTNGENTACHELKPLLVDYFTSHTEILKAVFRGIDTESLYEEMNITGSGTYKFKTTFLFMYDYETGLAYRVFGRPSPEKLSWAELHKIIKCDLAHEYDSIMAAAAEKEAVEKEVEKAKQEAEQKAKEKKDERVKDGTKETSKKPSQSDKADILHATAEDPTDAGKDVLPPPTEVKPERECPNTEKGTDAKTINENPVIVEPFTTAKGIDAVEVVPGVEADAPSQMEEQLPGQMNVEDYPEIMPDGQQDTAVEVDYTFNERIQTAEWLLEAVKKDNKSEARMYCRDLLRLLGDWED